MTRRVKQIPAMSWVYVEEDSRDHNGFFLKQFFEESLEKGMYTACY